MPPDKDKCGSLDMTDINTIVRHVLTTLTKRCDEEAENNCCSIQFDNKQARIKYYTGLPNCVVEQLLGETIRETQLNRTSYILILNTIKHFYLEHRIPTFMGIFEETYGKLKYKNDQPINNFDEFMNEIKALGFILKKTVNNLEIVMEDPDVRFERFMYLQRIKKFRNNSIQWPQIVYVDERLINLLSQKFVKPVQQSSLNKLPTSVEECVFCHAVSKTGFITGMFNNQGAFNKWLTDVLLVCLKIPSVIIMDSSLGLTDNVSSITKYHSKTEMIKWLTNKNIPCSNNMSKPALYELITKCSDNQKENLIDRMIKSQGHQILRLPRHLSDLSITTPLWDTLQEKVRMDIPYSLVDLQKALMNQMNSIPMTTWAQYEQDIETTEKEILYIDSTIENFCDMYDIEM